MSEDVVSSIDDQSHYEISLTAGQAFLAFVLLLLSLAASFAFGLLIGKGQADERLVVRKEPAVIQEGVAVPKRSPARLVSLDATSDDFKASVPAHRDSLPSEASPAAAMPVIAEENAPPSPLETHSAEPARPSSARTNNSGAPASQRSSSAVAQPAARQPVETDSYGRSQSSAAHPNPVPAPHGSSTVYAQLLSTGDQKTAETLAMKMIDHGFTGAYVERAVGEKGTMYRVRIRYHTEAEARAAEPKLRELVKEVWIAR